MDMTQLRALLCCVDYFVCIEVNPNCNQYLYHHLQQQQQQQHSERLLTFWPIHITHYHLVSDIWDLDIIAWSSSKSSYILPHLCILILLSYHPGFYLTTTSLGGRHVNGSYVRFAQRSHHHNSKQPQLVVYTDESTTVRVASHSSEWWLRIM